MNLEWRHSSCGPWGAGRDGRIRNPCWKTQRERGDNAYKWWIIHIPSRKWNSGTFWRRPRTQYIHLDTGAPNSRRKSPRFPGRIRRVSTTTTFSRLISECRWCTRWFLLHFGKRHIPPSRWTTSQTLLAERRIIPYSTEIYWRHQNDKNEFGCYARTPHRRCLEHPWIKRCAWLLDRFHSVYSVRRETSKRIFVVRWETDKKAANIQARLCMARTLDEIGKKCQSEGETKVVAWKAKTR